MQECCKHIRFSIPSPWWQSYQAQQHFDHLIEYFRKSIHFFLRETSHNYLGLVSYMLVILFILHSTCPLFIKFFPPFDKLTKSKVSSKYKYFISSYMDVTINYRVHQTSHPHRMRDHLHQSSTHNTYLMNIWWLDLFDFSSTTTLVGNQLYYH
jgi:hypothetical protein